MITLQREMRDSRFWKRIICGGLIEREVYLKKWEDNVNPENGRLYREIECFVGFVLKETKVLGGEVTDLCVYFLLRYSGPIELPYSTFATLLPPIRRYYIFPIIITRRTKSN